MQIAVWICALPAANTGRERKKKERERKGRAEGERDESKQKHEREKPYQRRDDYFNLLWRRNSLR